jgi:hypothetical protein
MFENRVLREMEWQKDRKEYIIKGLIIFALH